MSLLRSLIRSGITKLQRCQPYGLFPKLQSSTVSLKTARGMGIDISPMPAASWPNACETFAPAEKQILLQTQPQSHRGPDRAGNPRRAYCEEAGVSYGEIKTNSSSPCRKAEGH